ncbi:MAG: hypothetical protein ABSB01_08355 [Streptosporangiaceae bacterium]|jgi:hypothetical protein
MAPSPGPLAGLRPALLRRLRLDRATWQATRRILVRIDGHGLTGCPHCSGRPG